MSKSVNKTVVGAFVVGAFLLLFVMIMLLGGGNIFQKRDKYVIYFDGSLQGLNIGSPVKFRGVDIGEVVGINVNVNQQDLGFLIPVYFEIDGEKLSWLQGSGSADSAHKNLTADDLVKMLVQQKGLKGQLQMQSMITGTLFINFDFYPDKPTNLVGAEKGYVEVPSIPTTLEILSENISRFINEIKDLPLHELVANLSETSQGINNLVNSQGTKDVITNINKTLVDIQGLTKGATDLVNARETRESITNLNKALVDIQDLTQTAASLFSKLDGRVDPVVNELQETLTSAKNAFVRAQGAIESIESGLGEKAPLRRELLIALGNLSEAARSISVLTDYLQQHPEAIIKGKTSMEGLQ